MTMLFLAFVGLMVVVVVAAVARYVTFKAALTLLVGLAAWFTYVELIGHAGLFQSVRPPGTALVLLPVIIFVIWFSARSPGAALAIPLSLLLGTQIFRVGVELFLHQLWIQGLVPRMLTYAGSNVDIYIGASAPIAAWLSSKGRWGLKLALGWNIVGLLALANIVTRAVLTTPGPLNLIATEVPNRMIGTLPFTLIPAFFVPLALALHVLSIRSIRRRTAAP